MESVTHPSVMSPLCPSCLKGTGAPQGVEFGTGKRTPYFCCDQCGHRWEVTDSPERSFTPDSPHPPFDRFPHVRRDADLAYARWVQRKHEALTRAAD
jgi:hypothetical protein